MHNMLMKWWTWEHGSAICIAEQVKGTGGEWMVHPGAACLLIGQEDTDLGDLGLLLHYQPAQKMIAFQRRDAVVIP